MYKNKNEIILSHCAIYSNRFTLWDAEKGSKVF